MSDLTPTRRTLNAKLRPVSATARRSMSIGRVAMAAVSAAFTLLSVSFGAPAHARQSSLRVLTFATNEPQWLVVNDGVMGGISNSTISTRGGVLTFTGRVRLENNGGFASARSVGVSQTADLGLSRGSSVAMRVFGDGTTYQLTFDTGDVWFWAPVTPPARRWTTLTIPYEEFEPRSRFGERLSDRPYAGQPLQSIGLLVSNGQAQRFTIKLDWLDVVRTD